jgi:hypothetical protein
MSSIEEALLQAYLETNYHIDTAIPFILRVGSVSKPLLTLYQQQGIRCGVFVTACNPYSQLLDEEANSVRQADLKGELNRRKLIFFNGTGQHPTGDWPGETSFFVLGLPFEAAKALGKKYQQNAVVWCGEDAIPELILLE